MQINTSEKKYFLFSAHMQTLAKKKKKRACRLTLMHLKDSLKDSQIKNPKIIDS